MMNTFEVTDHNGKTICVGDIVVVIPTGNAYLITGQDMQKPCLWAQLIDREHYHVISIEVGDCLVLLSPRSAFNTLYL